MHADDSVLLLLPSSSDTRTEVVLFTTAGDFISIMGELLCRRHTLLIVEVALAEGRKNEEKG